MISSVRRGVVDIYMCISFHNIVGIRAGMTLDNCLCFQHYLRSILKAVHWNITFPGS